MECFIGIPVQRLAGARRRFHATVEAFNGAVECVKLIIMACP
jgi:hypothetical protein